MENKHTPGPWLADGGHIYETQTQSYHEICNFWATTLGEWEHNARLIAAAPDLLEALNRALNFIANTESEMGESLECGNMARAAIAKAKGQIK